MKTYYSPLRYPGGKKKLSNFFSHLFTSNKLIGGTYVEPYVGGGSVALHLLFNEIASRIVINDKDKSLYAFWYSVLHYNKDLCQLIKETPLDLNTWEKQKEIQKNKNNADLLTLGFSTFFLNRTNRSGIIKGGLIGGKDQTGNYKMDARFNKNELIERIKNISPFKDKIILFNLDAVELLKTLKDELSSKTMIYLDPPYYVKGHGLYMNYYNDEDHKNIKGTIENIDIPKWVITYDQVSFINTLYENYRKKEYSLSYCAQVKEKAKEYMFFSNNCVIPRDTIFKHE